MPIPIAIAVGAVLGALSRYYVTRFWSQLTGHRFPYGTLFANITGAFFIGLIAPATDEYLVLSKFSLVGFLGAYTTFSSYILDSANLLKNEDKTPGMIYWLGSPILGLVAVKLGLICAQLVG